MLLSGEMTTADVTDLRMFSGVGPQKIGTTWLEPGSL